MYSTNPRHRPIPATVKKKKKQHKNSMPDKIRTGNFLFFFVYHEKPRGTGSKILVPLLPKIDPVNHTLNFLHSMPKIGLLITLDS